MIKGGAIRCCQKLFGDQGYTLSCDAVVHGAGAREGKKTKEHLNLMRRTCPAIDDESVGLA
jgi:hypothetical protein